MVIEKKKMKGLCIYSFTFINIVLLTFFLGISLGIILADKIHMKILFGSIIVFAGIVGSFLLYYYCLITIYKVEYKDGMIVLSSLLKKYYVNNSMSIKLETIKNYYLQYNNRKLIFPKYNIMPTKKDQCYSMEEVLTIISWSKKK